MPKFRKAFLVWLAIMVPLVIGLTVIGLTCQDCQLPAEMFH
jgi:hypothetical protein